MNINNSTANSLTENTNSIPFLKNRLQNILSTLENIDAGNLTKAKTSLEKYKECLEYTLLNNIIEKSAPQSIPSKAADDKTYLFLKIIIESMPFPVFMKDEDGKYLIINSLEAELFGLDEQEIIGKTDSDFIKNTEEIAIIKKSDEDVIANNQSIVLPNQNFSLDNGKSYIFKTHKIPFVNPISGRPNILGFSIEVSDTVNLNKLKKIIGICSNPYA